MENRWLRRLLEWVGRTEENLKKKWWLWPMGVLIGLIEHRFYSEANIFLEKKGLRMLATIISSVPSNPFLLAMFIATLILVGVALHAYVDTRRNVSITGEIAGIDELVNSVSATSSPFLKMYLYDGGMSVLRLCTNDRFIRNLQKKSGFQIQFLYVDTNFSTFVQDE